MTENFPLGRGGAVNQHRAAVAGQIGPAARRRAGARNDLRYVAGLAMIVVIAGVFVLAATLFRGNFTQTVPVTVVSLRAGLVMNPDAKVKMRGVQVGKVASIEERPNGQAAIHLAMDPSQLRFIPVNVLVDIASSTVFGAKFVQLVPPADPSPHPMYAGQVLDGKHVTVEINTVFQQLTAVLSKIEPEKLNQSLGALASALNGRGHKLGQMLSDLDAFLATLEPSLPALSHDIAVTRAVANAYADVAPELVRTADTGARISQTIVDEQQNLDALLVSAIGLADIGNDFVGANRKPLTDSLHLLVPTTDLTNEYNEALTCGIAGMAQFAKLPSYPVPGTLSLSTLIWGNERYRYPSNLPRVAATGGPHCQGQGLPKPPAGFNPPFLVTDDGANPWQYGNQQLLINSDALKQLLYGPIDGPPRNAMQIAMPG